MKGIHRLRPHTPRRAKPVVPALLSSIAGVLDPGDSLYQATFACSLLLFHTLARLGSVLPASLRTKPQFFLSRDCVNSSAEGMLVTMLHTKTIQFGERLLHIPLVRTGGILCPVQAFQRHLSLLGSLTSMKAATPAFLYKDSASRLRWLTGSKFISTFRALAIRAGDHEGAAYSGHSFRRGGASWAFKAGVPGELIQILGDWSSDAYKRYLEFDMKNKLALSARFSRKVP